MSGDDGRSSASRLFDDGMADEGDDLCESRFAEGLLRLCPTLRDTVGSSSQGISTGEVALSRAVAQVDSVDVSPPVLHPEKDLLDNPLTTNHVSNTEAVNQIEELAEEVHIQDSRAPATILTTCERTELDNAGNTLQPSSSLRATNISPDLPPRPSSNTRSPSLPSSINISVSNEQNQGSRQSSAERRKRAPFLVSSYYLPVWVLKRGTETTMIQKRMCRRCKVVVQFKSASLLIHTANCRFTSLVSKKNALEQSRNKDVPEVSWDSREGEQREMLDEAKQEDRGREARDAVLAKRKLSDSGLDREAKRRKSDRKTRRARRECEPKDCSRLHLALTRAIIWHNLPFSICDRQNSYDTPFLEMLNEFKPEYPRCCKPNSDKFRNSYLPMYYNEIKDRVLRFLNLSLSGTYSYGTIMFDGWEDINGNAVVNVMLRVTSSLVSGTATLLLDSVYTKDKKVDAEKYVEIIEKVMSSFQGQRHSPFTGVNGVVSDSARACVKAKNLLASKHVGMVMIQDQAHAADLLMADLGKLTWVEEVLSKVNTIVQALRSNRKLLSRYKDLVEVYNIELKRNKERYGNMARLGPPATDLLSLMDSWELDELEKSFETQSTPPTEAQEVLPGEPVMPTQVQLQASHMGSTSQRTAVTLKPTVKTRFASAETMLEGYLRSKNVLKQLTRDEEFQRLYDGSRVARREERDKKFVNVIHDDSFYSNVVTIHHILRVIRRYLRVWDAENAQISEVVPATLLLDYSLGRIKTTPFLTEERKREVFDVLERRCRGNTADEGGSIHIRILQDVHYTAWLLDPNLCPVKVDEFLPAFERHARMYLSGAKAGKDEQGRKKLAHNLTRLYRGVHKLWDIMRKGVKNRDILESYAGHALRYWEDETPAETVLKDDVSGLAVDLQCFARYTLSLCPSSCATERSFSHQGRIHTKQRSRLKPEVVQKLLFCKWNARVLRNIDRVQFDKVKDTDKFKLGSINPYEDFMSKPATISVFGGGESEELLKKILEREQRTRDQIKSARSLLYGNLHLYIYAGGTQMPLPTEGTSSRHTMATSARLSTHERSTTAGGEQSTMVRSPSTPDEPRTYHATNTQELAVLLSASKEDSRKPRKSCADTVDRVDLTGTEDAVASSHLNVEKNVEANLQAIPQALRDEDNITISVATARAMMHNQDAVARTTPEKPSLVDNSDDRRAVQPRTSLSEARSFVRPVEKEKFNIRDYVNRRSGWLLNSRGRGRGRGRPNMAYVPIHENSQLIEDEDAQDDADQDSDWDDESNLL